jgi:hypothetical protein
MFLRNVGIQSKFYSVQQYRIFVSSFMSSWRSQIPNFIPEGGRRMFLRNVDMQPKYCTVPKTQKTTICIHIAMKTANPTSGSVMSTSFCLRWEATHYAELVVWWGAGWSEVRWRPVFLHRPSTRLTQIHLKTWYCVSAVALNNFTDPLAVIKIGLLASLCYCVL